MTRKPSLSVFTLLLCVAVPAVVATILFFGSLQPAQAATPPMNPWEFIAYCDLNGWSAPSCQLVCDNILGPERCQQGERPTFEAVVESIGGKR